MGTACSRMPLTVAILVMRSLPGATWGASALNATSMALRPIASSAAMPVPVHGFGQGRV
jgi:hypothetical protein